MKPVAIVALAALGALSHALAAALPTASEQPRQSYELVEGTPTGIESPVEGMISNRCQEHMWITSDGAVHLLVAGYRHATTGLVLYSSADRGENWIPRLAIPDTGARPKADGILVGDALYVVYEGSAGTTGLDLLRYVPESGDWLMERHLDLSHDQEPIGLLRPTIALDPSGTLWLAGTVAEPQTGVLEIRVGRVDLDTGRVKLDRRLGTPNGGERKSARVLASARGVGVLYTDSPTDTAATYTLNWAHHAYDRQGDDWQTLFLYEYTEKDGSTDAHGAHFNAAQDSLGNLHIATRSGTLLLYFKIADGGAASGPLALHEANAYPQVAVDARDRVYLAYAWSTEAYKNLVGIATSADSGESFALSHVLYYMPDANRGKARLEMPSQLPDFLPLVRQIEPEADVHSLVQFFVERDVR